MECPICKDTFINKAYCKCNHNFCKDCIIEWRKIENSCPICRGELFIETTDKINKMIEEQQRLEEQLETSKIVLFIQKIDLFFQNVVALLS